MRPGSTAASALMTAAIVAAIASAPSTPKAGSDLAGEAALDYAFRFATAVDDVKDRAKAQESAIDAYLELGLLDAAERRAAEIDGWRRGVSLGRIAALHARAGRTDRARELVAAAEGTSAEVRDWGRDRVLAQVAEVRALLGETERTREIAGRLIANDPRTYEGRATVAVAWSQASEGEVEGAARTMAALDGSVDLYVTWWRTEGYLDLARRSDLDPALRAEFLEKARASSAAIDGWKRAEALQRLAETLAGADRREEAVQALETAEEILLLQPETMSLKGPLLADLARSWNALGERDRALGLIATAERALERVASVVERPAALARVAAAHAALGRPADAERLVTAAIDQAVALQNPRPRALALSAICRETGRRGLALDQDVRARFDPALAASQAVRDRPL